MAITAVFSIPDMNAAQYDRVIEQLEAQGQLHPDGRLHHVANANGGGWHVVDIWESEEKLGAFAEVLMPIIAELGVTPPTPTLYAVHNTIVP